MGLTTAIQELHDRCAIYTSVPTASRLLNIIGWTSDANLSRSVLLEPCVGEGVILLEGVRRLLASFRSHGRSLAKASLIPRIKGFEFHPGAARSARLNLRRLLIEEGFAWNTAGELAETWIRQRDFLLERPCSATHVAANPPYVRWTKLPPMLAKTYRDALPSAVTRGDLSVSFLYRMQQWARERGTIAALVSDRWMYAQYGEEFVEDTAARNWSIQIADERPSEPFVRDVGAYSCIVVLTRGRKQEHCVSRPTRRTQAQTLHRALIGKHGTLGAAGCQVRVGPALGAGRTFIVEPGEPVDVEEELIRPFVSKQDLQGGEVTAPRLRVVVPYDGDGKLIDPANWPRFARWVSAHRETLMGRSQFRGTAQYWRTIDAVPAQWAVTPKLLLPELCNRTHTAIDRSGSIPAHSLYAIWSEEWPIEILQRVLNSGLLELTASAEAPKLKLGWMRFYKRFLMRTPLPKWPSLKQETQAALATTGQSFEEAFEQLFGFRPGALPDQ